MTTQPTAAQVPEEMLAKILTLYTDPHCSIELCESCAIPSVVRELQQARLSLTAAEKPAWQPIATAPVNEVVLLCDIRGNRWTDCSAFLPENGCGLAPAWWMPLPEGPK